MEMNEVNIALNNFLNSKKTQLLGFRSKGAHPGGECVVNHGKGIGVIRTYEIGVELSGTIIKYETARSDEYFIKSFENYFLWLGKSSYGVDPFFRKVWNLKTNKIVTEDSSGNITITDDNGHRKIYAIKYVYDALKNHLPEKTNDKKKK